MSKIFTPVWEWHNYIDEPYATILVYLWASFWAVAIFSLVIILLYEHPKQPLYKSMLKTYKNGLIVIGRIVFSPILVPLRALHIIIKIQNQNIEQIETDKTNITNNNYDNATVINNNKKGVVNINHNTNTTNINIQGPVINNGTLTGDNKYGHETDRQ